MEMSALMQILRLVRLSSLGAIAKSGPEIQLAVRCDIRCYLKAGVLPKPKS
jgi:hypothetical protein